MTLVSIITPVLNGEQYVEELVRRVVGQTHRPIEWVVADDDSTDRTVERFISQRDHLHENGITLTLLECNKDKDVTCKGAGPPRNRAIKVAKGEYLSHLDADDLMRPDRIEKQLTALLKHVDEMRTNCKEECGSSLPCFEPLDEAMRNTISLSANIDTHDADACPPLLPIHYPHALIGSNCDRSHVDATEDPCPDRNPSRYEAWINSTTTSEDILAQRFRECSLICPTWTFHRDLFLLNGPYCEAIPSPYSSLPSDGRRGKVEEEVEAMVPEDHLFLLRWTECGGQVLKVNDRLVEYRSSGSSASKFIPRRILFAMRTPFIKRHILYGSPTERRTDKVSWAKQYGHFSYWGSGRDARLSARLMGMGNFYECLNRESDGVYSLESQKFIPTGGEKATKKRKNVNGISSTKPFLNRPLQMTDVDPKKLSWTPTQPNLNGGYFEDQRRQHIPITSIDFLQVPFLVAVGGKAGGGSGNEDISTLLRTKATEMGWKEGLDYFRIA